MGLFEQMKPEAEFLDETQTKVFRVFLLAIHSHLYSFALEIFISSSSLNLWEFLEFSYCTLQRRKEENLIENHTLVPNGLRNPYWNLKSENCQDYA